jgi:uncharacterized protein (TIGR04255 family)
MPPEFPEVERVELANPILELVVCQLRFPTVLALAGNQPPAEFQQQIHERYPIARKHKQDGIALGAEIEAQVTSSIFWFFEDRQSQWTVSLGDSFISLETKQYRRFNEFLDRFLAVLEVARSIYPIDLAERLGLRYVDRIGRDTHPYLPEDWSRRIRSDIIPLRNVCGNTDPQFGGLESRFTFGESVLAIRSHYVDKGFAGSSEDLLVLDFDCYREQRESLDELGTMLRDFHDISYKAFRWAIGGLIDALPKVHEEEIR